MVTQLLEGVELRGIRGPLVVRLGQHLLAHLLHEKPQLAGASLQLGGIDLDNVAGLLAA